MPSYNFERDEYDIITLMFTYNSIKHSKSVYLVRVCLNDSLLQNR